MTSVPLRRPLSRFLVAASLLVGVSACGSSDDSGRQRNSALECDVMTDGTVPEGCDPGEQGNNAATQVDCPTQWDPTTGVLTLCTAFPKIEVTQRADKGGPLKDGVSVAESAAGASAVQIELLPRATRFDVAVWTPNPAGELRKAGSVEFEAAVAAEETFSYVVNGGGNSPDTDSSNPPPVDTVPPVPATDGAGEPPTTDTPVDTAPPADTVPAESTGTEPPTTEAPTSTTVLAPLLIAQEECSLTWRGSAGRLETCRDFESITVGVYGSDGSYLTTLQSGKAGATLDVPENVADEMKYLYFSVGSLVEPDGEKVIVSRAREWMTIQDRTQDASSQFVLDSLDTPRLRTEGGTRPIELTRTDLQDGNSLFRTYLEGFAPGQSTFLMVNGNLIRDVLWENDVVPNAASYDWRFYAFNEFGMLDMVGAGVMRADETVARANLNVTDVLSLSTIRVTTDAEVISSSFFEESGFVPTAECANSQPVLFTTPNSPSKSNTVTLSLDADCSSNNGVIALAVIRTVDFFMGGGFENSLVWATVTSTRYSSRINQTLNLPSGEYGIYYFSLDSLRLQGIDYTVSTKSARAGCENARLRVDRNSGRGVLESCTQVTRMYAGASEISSGRFDDFLGSTEVSLDQDGNDILLSSVPDGWWRVSYFTGRYGFPVADFALCVSGCDAPSAQNVEVDTSALGREGLVTVTDRTCEEIETGLTEGETPQRSHNAISYQAPADGYAFTMTGDVLNSPERLTGLFNARARSRGEMLIATTCSKWADTDNGQVSRHSQALVLVDASAAAVAPPANDNRADALSLDGVTEFTVNNFNATLEENEPLTLGIGEVLPADFHRTTWHTFTPVRDNFVRISAGDWESSPGFALYREGTDGKLGFVATNYSFSQLMLWMMYGPTEDVSAGVSLSFNVKAGVTYHLQVISGPWYIDPMKVTITADDAEAWGATTPPGPDSTVPPDTSVSGPPSTDAPADTMPAVTAAPATTTSTTDVPSVSETTVAEPPSTGAPADSTPPTTAAGATETPNEQRLSEGMQKLVADGVRTEPVPVLAPAGDEPARVEVREDAQTVTVTMQDLVASVTKSGASLDPNARILVSTNGGRRTVVSRVRENVTLPVSRAAGVQSISVTAVAPDGTVTESSIKVSKSVPALQPAGGDGGGSGFPVLPVGAAVIAALCAGAFLTLRRRGANEADPS